MKAAQITRFGGPDVLQIEEVEKPTAGAGEILVSVEASSVNGHDVLVRSGGLKFVSGRRFPIGVGLDFTGTVTALGAGAEGVEVGDRVWGTVHPRKRHAIGSCAQFVVVPPDRIARAPAALSSTEAAALVVAGATAMTALRMLDLRVGEHLLIRGASGGVGTAAVQLARARGAVVTAIARDRDEDRLRALGATTVLPREAAPDSIGPFDAILDVVGSDLGAYRRRLRTGGRMVTIALSGRILVSIALSAIHGSRRIRTFSANPDAQLLSDLNEQVNSGALQPVVEEVFGLGEVSIAHEAFERGGNFGKLVIAGGG